MKEKIDKKKIKSVIVSVIAFFVSYFGVQYLFFSPINIDKKLIEDANKMNKTCPVRIDQYLMLNNVTTLPNKVIQYNYTIIEAEKSQVNLDTLKKYIGSNAVNYVKTNPDMKPFRDNEVTVNYNYVDKNGTFLYKIVVTPDLYAKE